MPVEKAYLKVQRQREDFARKTASGLVSSHDLIAVEDLKIANLVKNHHLAKSINDAAWGRFLAWVRSYGLIHAIPIVEVVPIGPVSNAQDVASWSGKRGAERTHRCVSCGLVMDRDENAARTILAKALQGIREQAGCTEGHSGTGTPRRVRNASGQTPSTSFSIRKRGKRAG